ncbi:hypothetical protein QIA28_04845 [Borreliella tanukii]|nr:hypothetical protein [Borreliella tanukii]WKC80205.1 hypothetical protein QIA28_04845 [Borreliella tanukii]
MKKIIYGSVVAIVFTIFVRFKKKDGGIKKIRKVIIKKRSKSK